VGPGPEMMADIAHTRVRASGAAGTVPLGRRNLTEDARRAAAVPAGSSATLSARPRWSQLRYRPGPAGLSYVIGPAPLAD
jgi:hypothetical protein